MFMLGGENPYIDNTGNNVLQVVDFFPHRACAVKNPGGTHSLVALAGHAGLLVL
jgi:hypothetical protein